MAEREKAFLAKHSEQASLLVATRAELNAQKAEAERLARLKALAESRVPSSSEDLDGYWMTRLGLEDLAASGRVERVELPVLRVDTFSSFGEAGFLRYGAEAGELQAAASPLDEAILQETPPLERGLAWSS